MALEILNDGSAEEVRALFAFDASHSDAEVLVKFHLWARWFFPHYFEFDDAPFHREIDAYNLQVYRGTLKAFVDIAFRGAAKTTRTKLFVAFCIANDADHSRRFIKVLAADGANSKQIVTDVYNALISDRARPYYPEIFARSGQKREETMASFTTATGVKMQADTVGTDQRGDVQENVRPDFIWFDDFETRKTLRSAVTTKAIWDNMEEAKNGLSKDGSALYNCNYLSERGNVHKLVLKDGAETKVLITPIKGKVVNGIHVDGPQAWSAYTASEVEAKLRDADDPAGEYLCVPSAGSDVMFDRAAVNRQVVKTPIRVVADFKLFHPYDASHRYGSGHDVGGGVGLDSSTSVFIDFSTLPNRVVGTFKSNTIKPDTFGDEISNEADRFGLPLVAVENNKFDMCIGRLKQIYKNLYFTEPKEAKISEKQTISSITYGWNTNAMTKPKMLFELKKAVEDGHLELSDADLIAEARSYSRDDLMDQDDDPRLTTRHFDLLIAAAIAWQMRNFAKEASAKTTAYVQADYETPQL